MKIKSWKTTLLGGGALTAGITVFINDPNQWKEAVSMCLVGLIGLVAKDHNVSGK